MTEDPRNEIVPPYVSLGFVLGVGRRRGLFGVRYGVGVVERRSRVDCSLGLARLDGLVFSRLEFLGRSRFL